MLLLYKVLKIKNYAFMLSLILHYYYVSVYIFSQIKTYKRCVCKIILISVNIRRRFVVLKYLSNSTISSSKYFN